MKKVLSVNGILVLFWLLLPLSQLYSSGNWLLQQSTVSSKLSKCIFVDSSNGWAAGDSGVIVFTSNGGASWVRQNTGIGKFIFDMYFLDLHTGWAIASDINVFSSPVLLKTTNSGLNWQQIYTADSNYFLHTVFFRDALSGWLAGYGGLMLNTTDGGSNWAIVPPDTSVFGAHNIWNISFTNAGFGYACGGFNDIAGVIWISDNNGKNWRSTGVSPEPVYKIIFDDSLNGFGVGGDFEYGMATVKTTNGGNTWETFNTEIFGIGRSFSRRIFNEIWVPLSITPFWAVTTNNGANWISVPTDNNAILNDVIFTDPLHGWTVGDSGIIQKYNTAVIGIPGNQDQIITKFMLNQNFPNPFNSSTIIEFYLPVHSKVKLTVYDATGREMKVIVDEFRAPGLNKILFNSDNFASGIYFYKLSAGDFTETKKLVIVK